MDKTIQLAVLRSLAARGEQPGYSRPEIEGCSRDEVDRTVDELRRAGALKAALSRAAFGDNPEHWAPSVLTARGRNLLQDLERREQ